jgi:adenylate kinase
MIDHPTEADALGLLARIASSTPEGSPAIDHRFPISAAARELFRAPIDPLGEVRADRIRVLEADNRRLALRNTELDRDRIKHEIDQAVSLQTIQRLTRLNTCAAIAFLVTAGALVAQVWLYTIAVAPK